MAEALRDCMRLFLSWAIPGADELVTARGMGGASKPRSSHNGIERLRAQRNRDNDPSHRPDPNVLTEPLCRVADTAGLTVRRHRGPVAAPALAAAAPAPAVTGRHSEIVSMNDYFGTWLGRNRCLSRPAPRGTTKGDAFRCGAAAVARPPTF